MQSRRQQVTHAEKLAAKEAAGEVVVKKRKERSDKGKPRTKGSKRNSHLTSGQQDGTCTWDNKEDNKGVYEEDIDDNGSQPPRKKTKHAAAALSNAARQLPPASKEFINDNNSDIDDDGSDAV